MKQGRKRSYYFLCEHNGYDNNGYTDPNDLPTDGCSNSKW